MSCTLEEGGGGQQEGGEGNEVACEGDDVCVTDAAFKFWEELPTYNSPVVFCVTSEGGFTK